MRTSVIAAVSAANLLNPRCPSAIMRENNLVVCSMGGLGGAAAGFRLRLPVLVRAHAVLVGAMMDGGHRRVVVLGRRRRDRPLQRVRLPGVRLRLLALVHAV